jgi:CDP-diacylglycerol--serine O-phosphatidyltransferase
MIGFYNYTVWMTYAGLLFALFGMFQAVEGKFVPAVMCLGLSLMCDTLDGRIARAKTDRTPQQCLFGVQIDSLCDVVSFGIFPAVLCYCLGLRDWFGLLGMSYYCVCCVIRLGYFNVLAQEKEPGEKSIYHGLPVVGLAVILPAAFLLGWWLSGGALFWILRVLFPVMGTLYILNFKVNKPGLLQIAIIGLLFLIPMIAVCVVW